MIITAEQREQVAATLATINLGHGQGTQTKPCTIVAINMALTGKLTDQPHPCMSLAVRSWVIRVQDAMPVKMMEADDEHGIRWRQAAVDIAGSNDGRDEERRVLILDWMWECLSRKWQEWVPLSAHRAWATMLAERTPAAAERAVDAVAAYAATAKRAVDDAAFDAYHAAYAAYAAGADAAFDAYYDAYHAASAARYAATAERAVDDIPAERAADAAAYAAGAVDASASADGAVDASASADGVWRHFDPAALLNQLVHLP